MTVSDQVVHSDTTSTTNWEFLYELLLCTVYLYMINKIYLNYMGLKARDNFIIWLNVDHDSPKGDAGDILPLKTIVLLCNTTCTFVR